MLRGLVEEAHREVDEQNGKGPILDLVIVLGMQRIEHYEVAAYGTDIALAKALSEQDIVSLPSKTLEEEKATDVKLKHVTRAANYARSTRSGRRGGRIVLT